MTDLLDFTPLFVETLARVRARMDADANAGLLPDDPGWIDTREGTFYWDVTQVAALEIARLWDAIGSETVAAAFPSTAWGDYLDEHASTFQLVRNIAVQAIGNVSFIGDPDILVAAGTEVSAPPADPSLDAVTFQTTDSGTTGPQLSPPTGVTATPSATGGQLPAGTYIYRATAYNDFGETLASADVSVDVTGTASSVALAWNPVVASNGYRVYRTLDPAVLGQRIADVTTTSFTDNGSAIPGVYQPTANTTSGVTLPVVAKDAGKEGNLGAGAVTDLDTLVQGITLVTNPAPMVGGADPENDPALQSRILSQYQGSGAGNINWYVQQALAQPGVERAVCVPIWNGPGTVLVVPMLTDGSPVTPTIVAALQKSLDPIPGQGHGLAPVGVTVTVSTTAALFVFVAATINFATGYSLDGASGTVATRNALVAALDSYFASLNPGDLLSYQQVQAALLGVTGVISVSGLTVNSGTEDLTLGTDPPEYVIVQPPTFA